MIHETPMHIETIKKTKRVKSIHLILSQSQIYNCDEALRGI